MVGRKCCTINLILPVCISIMLLTISTDITERLVCIAIFAIKTLDKCHILRTIHNIQCLLLCRDRNIAAIANLWSLTAASLLCSDDDDTIRSTATINSGSRSILQYSEALDIVRVNHRQWVSKSLYALVVHCKTVDNDQWVVGCIK